MKGQENIKEALDRTVKALTLKPSLGIDTGRSITRVINGLTCEVTEKSFKLIADMPGSVGGNGAGPTPGVYGRAALGSCLAIGYMMRASQRNIPVESLQVEVQADFDDGVLFGTANGKAGYSEIRYTITIESAADEQDILQIIEEADNRSPYLDIFGSGSKCIRKVNIVSTKQS